MPNAFMDFFQSIRRFRRKIRPVGERLEKGRSNTDRLKKKNLAVKAAIFFVLIAITFFAYPRSELYQYEVEVGDYWRHESLMSPFDFAIYKDEGIIDLLEERECKVANLIDTTLKSIRGDEGDEE